MAPFLDAGWPEGVNDKVSAVLEEKGIPNVLWGDLANNLYGVDQIILNCGFVVSNEQLDLAAAVLADAGLQRCHCTTAAHRSYPGSSTALPTHFEVPNQPHCLIYLCPSGLLWNIIPLTAEHPNRLNLTVQRVDSGERFGESPSSRVLDAASTLKALTYLTVRATPARSGLALPWKLSLMALAIVRDFQPGDFGDSEVGSVLGQYWADVMETPDHPALGRLDAQRRLDEIEKLPLSMADPPLSTPSDPPLSTPKPRISTHDPPLSTSDPASAG